MLPDVFPRRPQRAARLRKARPLACACANRRCRRCGRNACRAPCRWRRKTACFAAWQRAPVVAVYLRARYVILHTYAVFANNRRQQKSVLLRPLCRVEAYCAEKHFPAVACGSPFSPFFVKAVETRAANAALVHGSVSCRQCKNRTGGVAFRQRYAALPAVKVLFCAGCQKQRFVV